MKYRNSISIPYAFMPITCPVVNQKKDPGRGLFYQYLLYLIVPGPAHLKIPLRHFNFDLGRTTIKLIVTFH